LPRLTVVAAASTSVSTVFKESVVSVFVFAPTTEAEIVAITLILCPL
jgi:hypothetical protein